ncbi:MAG: hypothetical protein MJE63_25440 [Proteobacteria bacterium]|nr:hypothetical protein [Pseudomonadota bacterium]
MEQKNSDSRTKRGWRKKIFKFLGIGVVSLLVITTIARWVWISSGSNEWELEIDRDGIKIYSLKTPGYANLMYKGVLRSRHSMNHYVMAMLDESVVENCSEWLQGCVTARSIEPFSKQTLSSTTLWELEFPYPFSHRETILKLYANKDMESQVVTINIVSVPGVIPPNDCCVRVAHLHNSWKYTPLETGEVQVEHKQYFDMGGFFPSLLINLVGAEEMHKFLSKDLPGMLDKKAHYKEANIDFLEIASN